MFGNTTGHSSCYTSYKLHWRWPQPIQNVSQARTFVYHTRPTHPLNIARDLFASHRAPASFLIRLLVVEAFVRVHVSSAYLHVVPTMTTTGLLCLLGLALLPMDVLAGSCREAKLCCPGRDSSCVVQKAPINAIIEDLSDKPCYCDHACLKLGDCCGDFKQACGGESIFFYFLRWSLGYI